MCNHPKFILRNKGAAPLTDLNIYFGVTGGTTEIFHWTGNLGFMESEEVELTSTDPFLWQGDASEQLTFFISLGTSADGPDENTSNYYAQSFFNRPPIYQYTNLDDNRLIVQLKTNQAYDQSSWTLYDMDGNIEYQRNNFDTPLTTYKDTIALNSGCYMFHLQDSGEDGLSFFANSDGTGTCKFDRVSGFDFINFENDFGKEIVHYFYWNTNLVSVEEKNENLSSVKLYPNPAGNQCELNIQGFDRNIQIVLYDQFGRLAKMENVKRKSEISTVNLDISQLSVGLYSIRVFDGRKTSVVKLVKQ